MDEEYFKYIENWDNISFDQFMDRYGQDVWNYAYFMTKKREVADDIAQDVFFNAYVRIAQYRGQSTIKTWLLSIARNLALNYFRSAFVRKVTLVESFSIKESSRSAEKEALDQIATSHIWSIVLQLPRKHREILILNVHYGLSIKEIAKMLEISEGTVKSRSSRARDKMKRLLREEGMRYDTI